MSASILVGIIFKTWDIFVHVALLMFSFVSHVFTSWPRPIQQLTIGIESLDAEIRDKIEKFKETKTKTH